jgi:hypothetical protein
LSAQLSQQSTEGWPRSQGGEMKRIPKYLDDEKLEGWNEIAWHLGVHPTTAMRYWRKHGLPAYRRVGRIMAYVAELIRWERKWQK